MPRGRRKKSGWGWSIGVVLLALSLLFLPVKSRDNFISRGVLSLVAGGHQFINGVVQGFDTIWNGYINLINVSKRNRQLLAEVARLQHDKNQMMELLLENDRLRQLLGFKAKMPLTMLPAQVVSRDPTNWFKTVVINKGKQDGITLKSTVVTHVGLVGHVIELSDTAAKVLLITDFASRVSVLVQRTRAEGILAGVGKDISQIEYLSRLADVRAGDVIVSSGLGGVFPKGLKVGGVIKVRKQDYGLFQEVKVAPAADLSRLEEVLVIPKADKELPVMTGEES